MYARVSNGNIKRLYRNGQRWLICHNKTFCKRLSEDKLTLMRLVNEGCIGAYIIQQDFYNVRQCLRYIDSWEEGMQ